jgi:ABC-2 type transporter
MLMQREISKLIRDKIGLITKISASIILVVFIVMTLDNMGISEYNGFQNFVGFFLLMSDNLIITGVNNAMRRFPEQRMVFMRDQVSGLYSVSAFFLAFITSNLPLALFIPSINMLIGFLITFMLNGIPLTLAKVFTFCKSLT